MVDLGAENSSLPNMGKTRVATGRETFKARADVHAGLGGSGFPLQSYKNLEIFITFVILGVERSNFL